MSRLIVSIALVLGVGCGGAGPNDVVSSRKVSAASGGPKISKVIDMGDFGALPVSGAMPAADSDGNFVVGEVVTIRGSDFGKQPTINIGGRPAEPMARTGSGAIITRIPPGVPNGEIEVEVSHPGGRNAVKITVRRHAFVVQPGANKVYVLDVGTKGKVVAAGDLALGGATSAAVSHDGQAVLVAATDEGRARVGLVATTASAGPKLVRTLNLEGTAATYVATAAEAPVAVVVGGGMLTVLDMDDARNPAIYPAIELGDIGGDVTAMAMSPNGKLLVLLLREANAVVPVDLSEESEPRVGAPVELMPDERVPLVRDLGFAPDGGEVWVVAGDNSESVVAGSHATQLVILSRKGAALSAVRTVEVIGATAPRALAVARRESIMGGTAIRSTSRRAAIVVATVDRELFAAENAGALTQAELGQLVRTDLDGEAEAIWTSGAVATAVMLSHDVSYVAAAITMVSDMKFGLEITPVAGGTSKFIQLGTAAADTLLARASVALMP
jgi:DNA-binding beta-propeller fold protein YncE